MLIKFTLLIICSAITLISGFMLSLKGNPYGKTLSSIHKIFSIISIVLLCLVGIPLIIGKTIGMLIILLMIGIVILVVLALISGGILLNKNFAPGMLFIHRIGAILLIAIATWCLLLLLKV